jgi:hypothetical protein
MRSFRLAPVALVFLAAAATPAVALDLPPLCQAMHGLGDAARATGQPQRLAVTPAGCSSMGDTPAGRTFCAAAARGGAEAADAFAWDLLRTCLNSMAAEPQVTTGAEVVEVGSRQRKRITHLAAKLGHGVWLDLTYAAARYDLVVYAAH